MKKKNLVPLLLMSSSIALLLLLQGLWLQNSYDKALNDLRRQTTETLRSTLIDMRDSIFLRNYDAKPVDTTRSSAIFFSMKLDTAKSKDIEVRAGTLHSRTEILVRGALPDSAMKSLRRFSTSSVLQNGNRVVVRFAPDSLNRDSIALFYRAALRRQQLDLPFTLIVDEPPLPVMEMDVLPRTLRQLREPAEAAAPVLEDGRLQTEWFRFAPGIRYASIFENVRPYLFMQIGPQILFSLALTLITAAAFFIMYRGIRSQQKLMELKNDFISNITHELKTPVTTVSVALEALRNFKGLENPKTTKEYLDIAQGELNRLTLLTDKVLKTAVFDHRGVNFEKEEVDLSSTVEHILHSMKLIFEKQKANVRFEKSGNSFTIHGGSVHLTNVIYNLLDNALKYGGTEPEIDIRLEETENRVLLKIADKGIGIPPEYRKKIFEKFFRVPTGDVHNIKGYGLGLSYVDSVIRSHNGAIDVQSAPGNGSVFTISLPKE